MVGYGPIGSAPIGAMPEEVTKIAQSSKIIVLAHAALLIPEANVPEGMLVKTYADLWLQLARELGNDWTKAFNLSDREWEEMLAGLSREISSMKKAYARGSGNSTCCGKPSADLA